MLFLTLLILLSTAPDTVEVSWDANTEPDLRGYKVYWGTESRNDVDYTEVSEILEATSHRIGVLASENNYFAVTAIDFAGNESAFSNEARWPEISLPPQEKRPAPPDSLQWTNTSIDTNYLLVDTTGVDVVSLNFKIKIPARHQDDTVMDVLKLDSLEIAFNNNLWAEVDRLIYYRDGSGVWRTESERLKLEAAQFYAINARVHNRISGLWSEWPKKINLRFIIAIKSGTSGALLDESVFIDVEVEIVK